MCPKIIASLLYAILPLKVFIGRLYFQRVRETCIQALVHAKVLRRILRKGCQFVLIIKLDVLYESLVVFGLLSLK